MAIIALISDIHFGKFSRTSEFAVPGEVIQDENKGASSLKDSLVEVLTNNQVQYLFIAGDLTSKGSPHEFYYCQNEIISIAEKAGILKENIIVGLGNHDVDWEISELCKKYEPIDNVDFPMEILKRKYQAIAANASVVNMTDILTPKQCGPAPFSGVIEKGHFIVFILNSGWNCTPDQKYQHGQLSKVQLDWFKNNLSNYKNDIRWKIVLLHHHPFNYSYPVLTSDISTLEEGSDFLDIAGECGINIIMHGHRHHPKAKTVYQSGWLVPITFICAGSVSVNSSHRSYGSIPNTIHIVDLTQPPGELILKNYEYSLTDGWIPIKNNCCETPIDPIMYFGKTFLQTDIDNALSNLVLGQTDQVRLPDWCHLPESLRFLTLNELNKIIKDSYSTAFDVIGKYPDPVFLLRR